MHGLFHFMSTRQILGHKINVPKKAKKTLHFSICSRVAKTLENVTLILTLEFQEFSRITLKKFSVIYCPHSHSQTLRFFENFRGFSKILEVNFSQGCRNRGAL